MTVAAVRKPVSAARIRRSVLRIMQANRLCSLATISGRRAHINTAFYAHSPNLDLYFLSDPDSLHSRNLAVNPSAAVAVFDSSQEWEDSGRGVQAFGTAHRTRGKHADRAAEVYGRRFPAYARWLADQRPEEGRRAARLRSYALYRFLPGRIKILDEAEFGGAVFVIADLRRGNERATTVTPAKLVWRATERLISGSGRR